MVFVFLILKDHVCSLIFSILIYTSDIFLNILYCKL